MIGYFADDYFFVHLFSQDYSWWQLFFGNTEGVVGGGSWRPITMLSYWMTFGFGLSETTQHIISILLYILCGWLLYLFLRKDHGAVSRAVAGVAAVIWLLWPVHVEPVMWIAARADLLATACALGALIFAAQKKILPTVLLYAASLLCKEFWILLPIVFVFYFSGRDRKKVLIMCAAVALAWFIARFAITGFSVGGYSIAAAAWQYRIFLLNEQLLSFFGGVFLFGNVQASVVAWVREWWFITSFILWGIIFYACSAGKKFLAPFTLLCATLIPILFLQVPFTAGHASIGEQRYWFAPTIALIWLLTRVISEKKFSHKKIIFPAALIICFFAFGFFTNTKYFIEAASYRNLILEKWRAIKNPAQVTATFAPDTYAGVHLFASPFFEYALAQNNLIPPAAATPWYSQHGPGLPQTYDVSRTPTRLYVSNPEQRFFSLNRAGIHAALSETISPTSTLAVWNGQDWMLLPPPLPPVDKSKPGRY